MSINKIFTIKVQDGQPNAEPKGDSAPRSERLPSNKESYWNMLHIFSILSISALSLPSQLLIPRHNSIYYPDHWRELLIPISLLCVPAVLRPIMELVVFTKEKSLIQIGVFLKLYARWFMPNLCALYISHFIWTSKLGFENPMPFTGIFCFFSGYSVYIYCLNFMVMIPSKLRMKDGFREKIKAYVIYEMWWFL